MAKRIWVSTRRHEIFDPTDNWNSASARTLTPPVTNSVGFGAAAEAGLFLSFFSDFDLVEKKPERGRF